MALVVQKFGGTSVADLERIRAVAARIQRARAAGDSIAVVVSAMAGATRERATVAIVPATNDPIAAVASAAAPRPALAIALPSIVVTTEAASPGVLSRIDVVDPPYIPP